MTEVYCVMEYGDDLPKLNFNSVFLNNSISKLNKFIFGKKSKRWQHEDEIRIIMDYFGKVEYDFRAVKAIYFGLRMPKMKEDLDKNNESLPDYLSQVCQEQIMQTLRGRGIKYYQMLLKPMSYEFEFTEVNDLYKDYDKYKEIVKDLDRSLIDYNGYGWKIDSSYFDKVAEITCREPYFYKINSIHISNEKSIERNEPIIFSGFYKAENDWVQIKRYFSLDEIDKIYNDLDI